MWWELTARGSIVINILTDIGKGDFEFSLEDLKKNLSSIPSDTPVTVKINSDGGSVFDGIGIYNALRLHKGEITTIVEGVAGSIASIIFLSGDRRIQNPSTFVMGHFPSFGARGRTKDLKSATELLQKADETIGAIYKDRTNLTTEQFAQMVDGDLWLSPAESVAAGFATEIGSLDDFTAHSNLQSLVAHVQKGVIAMDFDKWVLETFALEAKTLTDEQKMKLQIQFDLQMKTKSLSPKDAVLTDVTFNSITPVARLDIEDNLKKDNELTAENEERKESIQILASEFDGELDAEYLRENKLTCKGARGLAGHAIRKNWSIDKFELELHRASRISVAPAVHVVDRISDNKPALTCALLRNAGVPARKKQAVSDTAYGLEVWYDEKTLDASDKYRDASLGQILEGCYVHINGHRPSSRPGTQQFIKDIRESMVSNQLRAATGNTAWTGLDIFDDAANKMLWAAYEAQNTTWQEWVRAEPVSDFKTINIYRMTMEGGYQLVGADGELKHGGMSDDKYTLSADTYGKIVGLSRTDLINDDLGAFNRIMSALGIEGARFLEEMFYVHLLANLGTIFTSGNKNLVTAGASSDLGVDGLSSGEQLFADQVDSDNAPIMLDSSILLHGTQDSVHARTLFVESNLLGLQSANSKKIPDQNPHVGKFRPVRTPYLNNTSIKVRTKTATLAVGDAITGQDSNQWFLFPNPNSAMGSVVMGAFLNGQQRPTMEQQDAPFDVLGLRWRAYHDAGVATGDPKLGVRSPGA